MRPTARVLVAVLASLALLGALRGCAPHERGPLRAHPQASAAPGAPIRVGAWNIEWLGSPQRRSGPARGVLQSPADLADYIADSGVRILGLEEIAADDELGLASSIVAQALSQVEQRIGGRWTHRLLPARSGRNQLVGLAWDTARVTAVGEPRRIVESPEPRAGAARLWSRPPHGQLFSAGPGLTDFVVVPIHMKSDYDGDFSAHRAREAELLVTALPGVFDDRDILIIGDSNCDAHSEPAVAVFAHAGLVDLNSADWPTFWRGQALDRAFVPTSQPEFADRLFEVRRDDYLARRGLSAEQFKTRCSDHFMIVTQVRVMPDDD